MTSTIDQIETSVRVATKRYPITAGEMSKLTGCRERDVPEYVSHLRSEKHLPICSNGTGYFMAGDVSDIDETLSFIDTKLWALLRTRRSLRIAKKNLQPGLF